MLLKGKHSKTFSLLFSSPPVANLLFPPFSPLLMTYGYMYTRILFISVSPYPLSLGDIFFFVNIYLRFFFSMKTLVKNSLNMKKFLFIILLAALFSLKLQMCTFSTGRCSFWVIKAFFYWKGSFFCAGMKGSEWKITINGDFKILICAAVFLF